MPRKTMTYGDILAAGPKVRYWAIARAVEYEAGGMPLEVRKVRFDETAWKKLDSGEETEFVCRFVEDGHFTYLTAEELYGSEDEASDAYARKAITWHLLTMRKLLDEIRCDWAEKLEGVVKLLETVDSQIEKEQEE